MSQIRRYAFAKAVAGIDTPHLADRQLGVTDLVPQTVSISSQMGGESSDTIMSENEGFPCPDCGRDFDTARGVSIHHSKIHDGSYSASKVEKECSNCGGEFEVHQWRDGQKYCSESCMGESFDTSIEVTCDNCGETFTRPERKVRSENFCSRECVKAAGLYEVGRPRRRVTIECGWCADDFEVRKSRSDTARFCSLGCKYKWRSEYMVGENAPRWFRGYDPYYGPNWLRQRRRAVERDGEECALCGMGRDAHRDLTGGDLHVHHKTPFRTFDSYEEANRLANLITVCRSCHRQIEPVSQRRVEAD